MKTPLRSLLVVWLAISVIASIPLNMIDWGSPDAFHGTGMPFASVYWDRDRNTGNFIDFPNPYAPVLNIAAVFVAGALPVALGCWVTRILRERNRRKEEAQP